MMDKVLAITINNRLVKWADNFLGEYQYGRSTVDHIFFNRQIFEWSYEFTVDLYYLFVDY